MVHTRPTLSIQKGPPGPRKRGYRSVDLGKKADREYLSGPASRTFFRIAELWSLSIDEQMTLLGKMPRATFLKWRNNPDMVLPKDTLERISHVLGIYKSLQILLPDEKAADDWVKRPNTAPLFAGKSALDRMLSGQMADLRLVRQYLDAQRGGWA